MSSFIYIYFPIAHFINKQKYSLKKQLLLLYRGINCDFDQFNLIKPQFLIGNVRMRKMIYFFSRLKYLTYIEKIQFILFIVILLNYYNLKTIAFQFPLLESTSIIYAFLLPIKFDFVLLVTQSPSTSQDPSDWFQLDHQ